MTKPKKKDGVPLAPPFSPKMRQYIIDQLGALVPFKDIYDELITDEFTERTGIPKLPTPPWTPKLFSDRIRSIPKDKIAEAHEAWKSTFSDLRWSEEKGRMTDLSKLIDKLYQHAMADPDSIDIEAITEIRALMEQMRRERATAVDRLAAGLNNPTKFLLTNPRNIALDANLIEQLLLTFRNEIGGLHNLNYALLTLPELELIEQAVIAAKQKKLSSIPLAQVIEESPVEPINEEEDKQDEESDTE